MSRQRLVGSLLCALGLAVCCLPHRAAAQQLFAPPPPPQPYVGNPAPILGAPVQQPVTRPVVALQPPPVQLPPPPSPFITAQPGPVTTLPYPPPPPPGPPRPVVVDPNGLTPLSDCANPLVPPPGFFGVLEIGLVGPHVKNHLVGTVAGIGGPVGVALPSANLDWTGSPRIAVGYQFHDNMGQFLATYRSVVSSGTGFVSPFDTFGGGFLQSRLNMNVIDLDYATGPQRFAFDRQGVEKYWSVNWLVGARVATAYFDSIATGELIQQRVSNNFVGGGPHGAVELFRELPGLPGVSLFSRLEGAVAIGEITQNFNQTYHLGNTALLGSAAHVSDAQAVPMLSFRAGIDYTPPLRNRWLHFGLGYEFEYWWNVGNLGPSRADITTQGIYFRGEFSF